jgi:parallel beta-helix repeat protein
VRLNGLQATKVRTSATTIGILFAVVLGGFASTANAATLYVNRSSPSCSNAGSGTGQQPFCGIGAAASRAVAGDTVEVASGTYSETVTPPRSGTSTAPIVFTAAPGATVIVSGQTNGFLISGRNWITVNRFVVSNTTGVAIRVSNSSRIMLSGNEVAFAGKPVNGDNHEGIRMSNVADSTVSGNKVHDNTDSGIFLDGASTRNMISGNECYRNARQFERAAPGIRLYSAPGNSIIGNRSHHNEDSGIESYTGSNSTLVSDNVTYDNGDHGIDNYKSTGQRLLANTVYRNVTAGINVEASSTGATIANNISVDNGINSPRTKSNIRVDSTSTTSTTMDYDLVQLTSPDVLLIWRSTSYSSLSSFRSATGQEAHGIDNDPRWRSRSSADFHLTAGSPAVDSATSAVSGQPSTDIDGSPRFDDPGTPNTGAGPRTFDDRGAYELQPAGDAPPSAVLSVTPSAGAVDLSVSADASGSTDGDATPIATYAFDFGDGTALGPQTGATATHTYAQPGTYVVEVTVEDTAGLTSLATRAVRVSSAGGDDPPAAALSLQPSSGEVPLAVTADASGSTDTDETPIASYTFDFGDGTVVGPQTVATASHNYSSAGEYTVTVTVTDTAGLDGTATATVTAQAATNLIANPGFENNTSGWNTSASGAGVSLSRVAGGHSGDWAGKLANGGTGAADCVLNDSPNWIATTIAATYQAGMWVRADTAGATLKVKIREYRSGTQVGSNSTTVPLAMSWQHVTLAYTPTSPGSSSLDLNAYVSGAAVGTCFYVDDVSITTN